MWALHRMSFLTTGRPSPDRVALIGLRGPIPAPRCAPNGMTPGQESAG